MHSRTPGWHHPPGSARGKGKMLARGRQQDWSHGAQLWQGVGTGCGCPMRAGVPRSIVQVGRGLSPYLLLPPSWAPQRLITSCRSIPGPLCNFSVVAAPPDRSGCSLRPDSSQQDLAGSQPACLLPCACSALPAAQTPTPPAVSRFGDPQARGWALEAPLPWSSLPAWLEPWGEPCSPSRRVPEAGLAPEELPARWHTTPLPAAPPGPLLGQAGLGCCVPPASPAPPAAAAWPSRGQCCDLLQGALAGPLCRGSQRGPASAGARWAALAGPPWQQRRAGRAPLPTYDGSSRAGTCQPRAVSQCCT